MASASPAVLIVGAGPTGLAAALFLARRGVRVRLIDAAEAPIATSKALGVNPRTLALLAETGVTDRLLAEGQVIRRLHIHRHGRTLAVVTLDDLRLDAAYPLIILPQARTEALLTEAAASLGVVVERGLALTALSQDALPQTAPFVAARLSSGETVRAPLLFGADGAHSVVRKQLGLGFPGDAWAEPWQLIDVDLDGPPPDEAWIDFRPDALFVCLPFSGARFRLIGFGPPLLDYLPQGWRAGPVRWRSAFAISHRMTPAMSLGRVALGGDAAHIHSPIGARGMNLGIEDAFVFAACAADHLDGETGRLADYDRLRRPVDQAVVRRVRALTSVLRNTGTGADLARRLAIPVVSRLPFLLERVARIGLGLDHPVRLR